MAIDKSKMGALHEQYVAQMLGGRVTKGSGSQWSDPNDTRDNHHAVPFALSVQCKSTLGSSVSVTAQIRDKAVEEAGGELPAIALRFYPNERLDHLGISDDWTALRTAELSEVLETARRIKEFEANPQLLVRARDDWTDEQTEQFRADMEQLIESGEWQRTRILFPGGLQVWSPAAELPEEGFVAITAERLRGLLDDLALFTSHQAHQPEPEPEPSELDTLVVYSMHTGGEPRMVHQGIRVRPDGFTEPFGVHSVRVERAVDNKPRLVVNDFLVRRGELYVDSRIMCRVGFGEIVG